MSTVRRRQEIKRVASEGYQARVEGKSFQDCPQEYIRTSNRLQWQVGWRNADNDIEYAQVFEKEVKG